MAYRSGLVVAVSIAFVSLVVATACSSSGTTAAPATKTSEGGVVVATDLCKKTGNYDSCKACCDPPYGYTQAQQTFDTCMCRGTCATPCADSVCLTDPDASANVQSAACTQCLDFDRSAENCSAQAANVCASDPGCARYSQCVADACKGLPDSDAGH